MNYSLDIRSYVGVGDIKFGMTPREVEGLIGPASSVTAGFLGERTEYRRDNGLLATYSKEGGLVELGFSHNIAELQWDGKKLFTLPPDQAMRDLVQNDGKPYETVGFVVLLNLGVTLTGFHDEALAQKAVTVFAKGRWDDEISNMKPFSLP